MARNLYFILLSGLCLVRRFFVMQLLLYSLTRYKTYVKSQFYQQTDPRYSWERITKENVKLMHLFTQLFQPDLYLNLMFSIQVPECNCRDIFLISAENRKKSHTQVTGEPRSC